MVNMYVNGSCVDKEKPEYYRDDLCGEAEERERLRQEIRRELVDLTDTESEEFLRWVKSICCRY